jgi:hypothetical protein
MRGLSEGAELFHAETKIETRKVAYRDFAKVTRINVETAVEAVFSGHGLGYDGNDWQ